ncbi:5'-3' exonuclease [Paenibacillus swuensis]|uniref:5'-3' exonuclease n=1 Tax=Paenibacillus swuensis TaxID=1178515 RepID=A0A172TPC0_9BACL|nr:5'-3' exonuclease H3TH domain-containing protein [Paenibacillus swuensis]ANE48593.1 5'-3' exonuclease [Paenibacillus swuensis]
MMNEEPLLVTAKAPSILIVDSFALLFRGFFALAISGNYMRNSKGLYTNGLYQFTRYLMDAVTKFEPSHVICAFDMGSQTFRNELYPSYKANRGEPPLELLPQFDKLWELVEAMGIPCVGKPGYEADDVMGSLAKQYSAQGMKVSILTGDGDTLQLIDENTQIILTKKGFGNYEVVHHENLFELRGLTHPHQVIDIKALMGDPSDNYPGVKGIGAKTALKLIQEHATIDGVLENLELLPKGVRAKIEAEMDMLNLSRKLARIECEVDITCALEDCRMFVDRQRVIDIFEEFEFRSLMKLIG